jgi:hypothetical protein
MRGLLKSIPPTLAVPTCDGAGRFRGLIADKALVYATQGLGEPLQNAAQLRDDARKSFKPTTAMQFCGVVRHGFDTKYVFAFGIDLQRQSAAVQLEDGQIIRRSLDCQLPFRRSPLPLPVPDR